MSRLHCTAKTERNIQLFKNFVDARKVLSGTSVEAFRKVGPAVYGEDVVDALLRYRIGNVFRILDYRSQQMVRLANSNAWASKDCASFAWKREKVALLLLLDAAGPQGDYSVWNIRDRLWNAVWSWCADDPFMAVKWLHKAARDEDMQRKYRFKGKAKQVLHTVRIMELLKNKPSHIAPLAESTSLADRYDLLRRYSNDKHWCFQRALDLSYLSDAKTRITNDCPRGYDFVVPTPGAVRGAQKIFGASVTEKDTAELCRGLADGVLADICCPLAIDRRQAAGDWHIRMSRVHMELPGGPEALVVPMTAVDVAKALHEFDKFSRAVYPDLTCKNNAATALPKLYKWSRASLLKLAPEAWYTYRAVLEQNAPPRRLNPAPYVQGRPKTFDASEGPSSAKNGHVPDQTRQDSQTPSGGGCK